MSYSLKGTAHKLRPILLLRFYVQLLFTIPSQKQDKKNVSWQYLEEIIKGKKKKTSPTLITTE